MWKLAFQTNLWLYVREREREQRRHLRKSALATTTLNSSERLEQKQSRATHECDDRVFEQTHYRSEHEISESCS